MVYLIISLIFTIIILFVKKGLENDSSKDRYEPFVTNKISNYYPLNKKNCIEFINHFQNDLSLNNKNTNFSNENKSKSVWWLNIPPHRFSDDLNLLLVRRNRLYWIEIPKGAIPNPLSKFRYREEKGVIDLEISCETGIYHMRDVKSGGTGFGFKQYLKETFE